MVGRELICETSLREVSLILNDFQMWHYIKNFKLDRVWLNLVLSGWYIWDFIINFDLNIQKRKLSKEPVAVVPIKREVILSDREYFDQVVLLIHNLNP